MSIVFTFRMSGPSATFLREQANGLFDWCVEEDRPEDLFFCASDGEVLLSSTAHERSGTLTLSKNELSVFLRAGSELAGWEGSRILAKHYRLP